MNAKVAAILLAVMLQGMHPAFAEAPSDSDPLKEPINTSTGARELGTSVVPGDGVGVMGKCSGGPGVCEQKDRVWDAIQGGSIQEGAYWLAPSTGLRDAMESKALVNRDTELLTTPKGLLNTTWMMLEPGIATGMHTARVESELTEQNHYLSHLAFLQQMAMTGEESTFDAYQGCIVRQANLGKPWLEQVAWCQRDVGKAQLAFNQMPAADSGAKISHILGTEGPAPVGAAATPAPIPTATSARLWDVLLAQASLAGTVGATLPDVAAFLRQNFGDVQFEWNGGALQKTNNMPARTDKVQAAFYEANYKMLVDLMYRYCDDTNKKATITANAHDPWSNTSEDFWTKMQVTQADVQSGTIPVEKQFWDRLSLPRVRFTAGIGEALWRLWANRYTADRVLNCGELLAAQNDFTIGELKAQPGQADEHLVAWKLYAALLARGHTIVFAQKWLSVLNRLPFTPSSNLIKQAQALIKQQTRVQDPDADAVVVAQDLVTLIRSIFERRAYESGLFGRSLGEDIGNGSTKKADSANSIRK